MSKRTTLSVSQRTKHFVEQESLGLTMDQFVRCMLKAWISFTTQEQRMTIVEEVAADLLMEKTDGK